MGGFFASCAVKAGRRGRNGVRFPMTAKVGLMQAGAAALGLAWGFLSGREIEGVTPVAVLGVAVVCNSALLPRIALRVRLTCGGVAAYQFALMAFEVFQFQDDNAFHAALGLTLLAVCLFAIGVLARLGVWGAAFGTALFFAASVALIIHNGVFVSWYYGGGGFLARGYVR